MIALSYVFTALPYVTMFALGLAWPLLTLWCYRNVGVGASLYALGLLVNTLLPRLGPLNLGISLYLLDLVTILIMPVVLLRLVLAGGTRVFSPALYLFFAVLALNLAQGLLVFGAAGGNAARADVYSLVALAYALTFPADARVVDTLLRVLKWLAGSLMTIVVVRWLAVGLQIDALLPPSGSFQPAGHSVWRVIVSNETLLLAQIAVAGWFFAAALPALRGWRLPALALLPVVVVLQHRSTWLAALVGIAAALMSVRRQGGSMLRWLVSGLAVVGMVVAVLLSGDGGGVGEDVVKSARSAALLQGTAGERLGSWQQLVLKWWGDGPRALAIGYPYGTSNARYVSDDVGAIKIEYQAHNYYVTVLTGLGLIGFAAYMALWWKVAKGLFAACRDATPDPAAAVLLSLVAAQAAYYLTYGTDYLQALILGTALSYVTARQLAGPLHRRANGLLPDTVMGHVPKRGADMAAGSAAVDGRR